MEKCEARLMKHLRELHEKAIKGERAELKIQWKGQSGHRKAVEWPQTLQAAGRCIICPCSLSQTRAVAAPIWREGQR